MNDALTHKANDVTPSFFSSLSALRAAHNNLLKRRAEEEGRPEFLADVAAFVKRAQATGVSLYSDDDRWAGQSLLDYWSNALYRAGRQMPESTLATFDPQLAPELDDAQVPYRGLDAFGENNSAYFFGRQQLIAE